MILITAPGFDDLTSLNEQLPEVVRMAMGATVSRIRIELIFGRCWNLITPCAQHSTQRITAWEPIRWRRSDATSQAVAAGFTEGALMAWERGACGGLRSRAIIRGRSTIDLSQGICSRGTFIERHGSQHVVFPAFGDLAGATTDGQPRHRRVARVRPLQLAALLHDPQQTGTGHGGDRDGYRQG